MNSFEKNIRKVEPYVPGEQPRQKVIKLNTNENPYPPAPEVQQMLETFEGENLRLYPDPAVTELTEALAAYHGVKKNQMFVGVGSDDVLSMCFLTFFNSEKPLLFPDITYSFYKVWAELYRIPHQCIKLNENFRIIRQDYRRENGGIIFPNPNAPTGIYEDLEVVEGIISDNQDSIVIVDEAYIDFSGRSALSLIEKYENLIVVRTFSKSRSLAGMRIGYAAADEKLIRFLNDVKYSFNSYTMNLPSIKCGVESVKNEVYFREVIKKITDTRTWCEEKFEKLGFTVLPSGTNFLFVSHHDFNAKALFEALKKEGIYVRYFEKERIEQYLRVTIGTDEEMRKLFAFIENYRKIISE